MEELNLPKPKRQRTMEPPINEGKQEVEDETTEVNNVLHFIEEDKLRLENLKLKKRTRRLEIENKELKKQLKKLKARHQQ
jgi:hypothetical protein